MRFSLSDLRRDGVMRRGTMANRTLEMPRGDGWIVLLRVVSDIDCHEARPCLRISGRAYGQTIDQHIPLVSAPQPLGGERWFALCPRTSKRCLSLVLPPGRAYFASVRGWEIPYASQRKGPMDRALQALDQAEERLARLSKYARIPTRERLLNKIAELDFAWERQTARWLEKRP